MSEQIKVGDLVQVVRPLGCGPSDIDGHIFTVACIENTRLRCIDCGELHERALAASGLGGDIWLHLWRLKRIPPLSELESEKRDEEITA